MCTTIKFLKKLAALTATTSEEFKFLYSFPLISCSYDISTGSHLISGASLNKQVQVNFQRLIKFHLPSSIQGTIPGFYPFQTQKHQHAVNVLKVQASSRRSPWHGCNLSYLLHSFKDTACFAFNADSKSDSLLIFHRKRRWRLPKDKLIYCPAQLKWSHFSMLQCTITGSFLTLQFHVERKIKNNMTINSTDLFLFKYPALQFITKIQKIKVCEKNTLTENACRN